MRKRWALRCVLVLALFIVAVLPAGAVLSLPEQRASDFVSAFQKGEWERAQAMCSDAALSFVEYVAARGGKTDGLTEIVRVETAPIGESLRAKVYYRNGDGQTRVRYLKLREVAGEFTVIDDRMMGSDWISSSYKKGLFAAAQEIGGVRLAVLGFLEVPPEIKIDMIVQNVSASDKCYIYPSLEAFYVVTIDGSTRKRFFASPPENVPEAPISPGSSMRSFAIFPYWASDPALSGKQITSLDWTLFVPFGPIDQFAIDYM